MSSQWGKNEIMTGVGIGKRIKPKRNDKKITKRKYGINKNEWKMIKKCCYYW